MNFQGTCIWGEDSKFLIKELEKKKDLEENDSLQKKGTNSSTGSQ